MQNLQAVALGFPCSNPIKVVEGIFIGDELCGQDYDFLLACQVSHVVNCAGAEVPNYFESSGIRYLTFRWPDDDRSQFYDSREESVRAVARVVEDSRRSCTSVLIHAARSFTRSSCLLAAYFMFRYRWSLYKTLQFLNWRKPDLEIKSSFFKQLTSIEAYYLKTNVILYSTWDQLNSDPALAEEQILIKNTYLNANLKATPQPPKRPSSGVRKPRLYWRDNNQNDARRLVEQFHYNKDQHSRDKRTQHADRPVRSILRREKKTDPPKPRESLTRESLARRPASTSTKSNRERVESDSSRPQMRESFVNTVARTKKVDSKKELLVRKGEDRGRGKSLLVQGQDAPTRAPRQEAVRQPIRIITPVIR